MEAIGLLESNSIAKGIEAADAILKAAQTELLVAKPTCPGKYTVLFTGDVAAVKASLDAGEVVLGSTKVDSEVIPRIHEQVVETLKKPRKVKTPAALGVMEFRSIIAAVYAADAAVKAAEVELIETRLGTGIGGKSFVTLTGEVAAVKSSVDAGMAAGEKQGHCFNSVVIASPRPEIYDTLVHSGI